MDRTIVERKLEALRRCVARVQERRPSGVESLAADPDAQDVLVLNLSRAVQVCVDIAAHLLVGSKQAVPGSMGETFTQLAASGFIDEALATRLRRAVGFRNIAVHNYEVMDWTIVHTLAGEPMQDFAQFARLIGQALDREPGRPG